MTTHYPSPFIAVRHGEVHVQLVGRGKVSRSGEFIAILHVVIDTGTFYLCLYMSTVLVAEVGLCRAMLLIPTSHPWINRET